MKQIQQFLNSGRRSEWVEYPDMKVFVRDAHHSHPTSEKLIECFDVANVYVYVEHKGTFTSWFNALCATLQHSKFKAIYIESVINPEFADYFRRRKLLEVNDLACTPSFYLMLD